MFLDSREKKDCCGCMACSRICPVSAIEMKEDEKGFYYPRLDEEKCLNCGICESVCPMKVNHVGQDASPSVYAVKCHDAKTLYESSSGGMFSLLAAWILEKGGVVYGVAFDENFFVHHKRACTMAEVEQFRTSKYVESDLTQVYESICDDLRSGKYVFLTGTPCQISALTKFLFAKRINTENLYTCDNICHGVPSRKIWREYIDVLKKKYIGIDDEIVSINMRSKKTSWKKQVMDVSLKKGNIDALIQDFSFNRFYLSLFGNRPSCFNCKYTSYKRSADFSLGDFWNVEQANVCFDTCGGVNVVLVNTEKGEAVLKEISMHADKQRVTKKSAWQPHLEYSANVPKHQDKFWTEFLSAQDKEKIIRKYMHGSLLNRLIRFASPILRKTGLYGTAGKLYKMFVTERNKNK